MAEEKKKMSAGQSIFTVIIFLLGAWYFLGGGLEKASQRGLRDIENKVATDAAQQYEITKRHGNRTDICVQAGMVKAAYLQANDEINFQKWTSIEATDCAYLGRR